MTDLKSWLDDQREARGLTVEQFAGLAGVTVGAIYHWRAGRNAPSAEQRWALIDGLGLGPEAAAELRRLCDEADRTRRERNAQPAA